MFRGDSHFEIDIVRREDRLSLSRDAIDTVADCQEHEPHPWFAWPLEHPDFIIASLCLIPWLPVPPSGERGGSTDLLLNVGLGLSSSLKLIMAGGVCALALRVGLPKSSSQAGGSSRSSAVMAGFAGTGVSGLSRPRLLPFQFLAILSRKVLGLLLRFL